MPLTRDQLLARKTGTGTVTFADGSTVKIRALTRDQVLEIQGDPDEPKTADALADKDNRLIAAGLLDPQLSVEDVAMWAKEAPAGDLMALSDAIAIISGMTPDAGKESYKSVRSGS